LDRRRQHDYHRHLTIGREPVAFIRTALFQRVDHAFARHDGAQSGHDLGAAGDDGFVGCRHFHDGNPSTAQGLRRWTTWRAIMLIPTSPSWLVVTWRPRTMPISGRDFDSRVSMISLTTVSVSPGRTGLGQRNSSILPPITPPAGRNSPSTTKRIMTPAVCQ